MEDKELVENTESDLENIEIKTEQEETRTDEINEQILEICLQNSKAIANISRRLEAVNEVGTNIKELQDLFVRRLYDDKQKKELISYLEEATNFIFIKPFLSDLILLLDRVSKEEGDFAESVAEELYDALIMNGVKVIEADGEFNPKAHKAIKAIESDSVDRVLINKVIRQGYMLGNNIIRAAEVEVLKPKNI